LPIDAPPWLVNESLAAVVDVKWLVGKYLKHFLLDLLSCLCRSSFLLLCLAYIDLQWNYLKVPICLQL
jgi:hypothetical protein